MNIKEATKHIKSTIEAYMERDEWNNFVIPVEKQRPLFLYGPPGIGKTAVVEQIADELGIGIVTYSMTHHTRQSALGLPFIKTVKFGDTEYRVSEYTMSEILASVYKYIEETGKKNGILFLDEINCVSETLSPSMLRFLQYKTFGSHKVPDGWVIVAAGNPPEYNKSVREYDIATLDRIQKISVDSDYNVWREYAIKRNVHPSIISFLDVNEQSFYCMENTPARKEFVTARGWEDLSRLIFSFEKKNVEITAEFIGQYIQIDSVAESFFEFYVVFNKMQDTYSISDILHGKETAVMSEKLKQADVPERIGFINYLSDSVSVILLEAVSNNAVLKELAKLLKDEELLSESCGEASVGLKEKVKGWEPDSSLIAKNKRSFFNKSNELISLLGENEGGAKMVLTEFINRELASLKELVAKGQAMLSNATRFMITTFGDSPEKRIFTDNITTNTDSAAFLISFGCDEFSERENVGFDEIDNLLKGILD